MAQENSSTDLWKKQILRYKFLLLAPIIGCTALAIGYGFVSKPKWSATQVVMIREESSGRATVKPGRFDSLDQMKTVQETILETARRPSVMKSVLEKVGRPSALTLGEWPSTQAIEQFQEQISISAPNGAEFGMTEMLHFTVKDVNKERSIELVKELMHAVRDQYTQLRAAKAGSIEQELLERTDLHQSEVDRISSEIEQLEASVGIDLGELRGLSSPGGTGSLASVLANSETELRAAETKLTMLKNNVRCYRSPKRIRSKSFLLPTNYLTRNRHSAD